MKTTKLLQSFALAGVAGALTVGLTACGPDEPAPIHFEPQEDAPAAPADPMVPIEPAEVDPVRPAEPVEVEPMAPPEPAPAEPAQPLAPPQPEVDEQPTVPEDAPPALNMQGE